MDNSTISAKAKKVEELFELLFDHTPTNENTLLDLVQFQNQMGRFKLWSGHIGVFAGHHASLDYRLRDDPEASRLMHTLLDNVIKNVRQAVRDLMIDDNSADIQLSKYPISDDNQSDAQYSLPSSYASSDGCEESVADSDHILQTDHYAREIELLINTMFRLATIIRGSSSRKQNPKATTYVIKDEEGNDYDESFLQYALKRVQHLFPGLDKNLANHLAQTIRLRRRILLYRRQHQVKLRYRRPVDGVIDRKIDDFPGASTMAKSISMVHNNPAAVTPSITSASALSKAIHLPSMSIDMSMISRTIAPESNYDSPIQIPRPPRGTLGAKEVECPYCCSMIRIEDLRPAEWRRHFLHDLEPFVCVFDQCLGTNQLYTDHRTWQAHMEQFHIGQQWVCSAPGHSVLNFTTDKAFEDHMWQVHLGTFADNHLPIMKKRAVRSVPIFTSCPLCGLDEAAVESSRGQTILKSAAVSSDVLLLKHVASHLQSLAMISLPLNEDEVEDEVKSAATVSRDTIFSDNNLPTAIFDDQEVWQENQVAGPLPHNADSTAEEGNNISPSGDLRTREWGFIEYPSDFGPDRDPILQPFLRKAYIESFPYLPSQRKPQLPCYMIPFSKNSDFFGRDKTLIEMSKMLNPSNNSSNRIAPDIAQPNPRTYAIHGLGGMGKTQLAIEFAYRSQQDFHAIFWVNAADRTSLDQDFNKIALRLGLVAEGSTNARDFKYTRELVKRWLLDPLDGVSDRKAARVSWLLVYDGVGESTVLNEFWPYDAPGSVLMTSRNPASWPNSHALLPFSGDEASKFLLQLSGKEWDESSRVDVTKVSNKLGGLPLALTQMASLMKHRGLTFDQFVKEYNEREKRQELLSAHPDQSTSQFQYGHSLASVWALEHLSTASSTLLDILSFVHQEDISERLFIENIGRLEYPGFPQTFSEYDKARAQLLESSVISRNNARSSLFIHRMIQDVARGRLSKDRLRNTFMLCVQLVTNLWPFEVFPSWRHGVERWETCEEFFRHILRLVELSDTVIPSDEDFDGDYKFLRILVDAGWYRHERGRPDESELLNNLAQRLCDVWGKRLQAPGAQKSQPETRDKLRWIQDTAAEIRHNQGCIASEINAPDTTFNHFKLFNDILVRDYERIPSLYRGDMRLAISWNELGNAHMLRKEWTKGEECFQYSIETMRRLENFQEIDLSLPLVNMGLSYWIQGRHEEALNTLQGGLKTRQEVHGDIDLNSFTRGRYLHALGNVKESMGARNESLEYHRRALHHYKATLGSNHHRTADLYVKVTQHSIRMKQDETALVLIDHALRAYGDNEIYAPERARALFLRSEIHCMMKQAEKAAVDLEKAKKLYYNIIKTGPLDNGRTAEGIPTIAEFDSVVAFWSR